MVDPSTELPFATVAGGNAADVDAAVAAARRAFPAFSGILAAERLALLARVLEAYRRRADEMAQVLSREMGVALSYTRRPSRCPARATSRRRSRSWARIPSSARRARCSCAGKAIGVCGLITPWNWPLNQIAAKVAPALAAGCTVVLKPSELSPFNALLFARAVEEAGVPPGVFNLVNGTGEAVGAAMSSHPGIDMMSSPGPRGPASSWRRRPPIR